MLTFINTSVLREFDGLSEEHEQIRQIRQFIVGNEGDGGSRTAGTGHTTNSMHKKFRF